MSKIIEFPVPSGELLWITGALCRHCDCEQCRELDMKILLRFELQQRIVSGKPPLHEGCDCRLVERLIGEEKGDYHTYKPGITKLKRKEL